jgi:hypothetical protein
VGQGQEENKIAAKFENGNVIPGLTRNLHIAVEAILSVRKEPINKSFSYEKDASSTEAVDSPDSIGGMTSK